MKDPHEADADSQLYPSPPKAPCRGNHARPPHGRSNSLLLLQLRTEFEGKWRPDKLGIARRWMNVSPKQWFCQKEDVFEFSMRPSMIIRNASSSCQRHVRKKQKARGNVVAKSTAHSERFVERSPLREENDKFIDYAADLELKRRRERRARRLLLEEEVMTLQKRLYKEMDLHLALETALEHRDGDFRLETKDLPTPAKALLEDIAALEVAVAHLEEKSRVLQYQIIDERKERIEVEQAYASTKGIWSLSSASTPSTSASTPSCSALSVTPFLSTPSRRPTSNPGSSPSPKSTKELLTLKDHLRLTSDSSDAFYHGSFEGFNPGLCQSPDRHVRFSPSVTTIKNEAKPLLMRDTFARSAPNSPKQSYFRSEYPDLSTRSPPEEESILRRTMVDSKDSDFSFPYSPSRYSPSSPARHSFSGISSDRSGSCAPACGFDQDLGGSSPGNSDFCTLPTSSPPSPEHRVRPTSPANFDDLRLLCDSPSERYVKELSKILPSTEQTGSWSKSSDEFHSPKAASSLGDYLSGESKPSSAEKPRSKFRVKMNLNDEFTSVKSRKAFAVGRGENSMGPLFPPIECPVECVGGIKDDQLHFRDYSQTPNLLSEEMVRCMMSIYCHLADPAVVTPPLSSYDNLPSPTSPLGHVASSSFSSISESSLLSFVRSPLVDLRSKEEIWGNEKSLDPYKVRGKVPWADLGAYSKVLEVPWMSVSKDQLGYAAQALQKFRSLVEQLRDVIPRVMAHTEKLAFWINLYNALVMHAYLAYGIPRNDLKYFALLQKAAYNVGGHSFNAATIEFSLLRGKAPSYRPHIGLLMALHRSKFNLTDEQSCFAIDYPEPQMVFALCCGTRSSPAVRVFTAESIHKELDMALRDYARAAVGLNGKGKLLVPKLLHSYAREFLEDATMMDWVCQLLPPSQAALVMEFWQQRQNRLLGARKFEVLGFDFNFRYLFAPNFDKSFEMC